MFAPVVLVVLPSLVLCEDQHQHKDKHSSPDEKKSLSVPPLFLPSGALPYYKFIPLNPDAPYKIESKKLLQYPVNTEQKYFESLQAQPALGVKGPNVIVGPSSPYLQFPHAHIQPAYPLFHQPFGSVKSVETFNSRGSHIPYIVSYPQEVMKQMPPNSGPINVVPTPTANTVEEKDLKSVKSTNSLNHLTNGVNDKYPSYPYAFLPPKGMLMMGNQYPNVLPYQPVPSSFKPSQMSTELKFEKSQGGAPPIESHVHQVQHKHQQYHEKNKLTLQPSTPSPLAYVQHELKKTNTNSPGEDLHDSNKDGKDKHNVHKYKGKQLYLMPHQMPYQPSYAEYPSPYMTYMSLHPPVKYEHLLEHKYQPALENKYPYTQEKEQLHQNGNKYAQEHGNKHPHGHRHPKKHGMKCFQCEYRPPKSHTYAVPIKEAYEYKVPKTTYECHDEKVYHDYPPKQLFYNSQSNHMYEHKTYSYQRKCAPKVVYEIVKGVHTKYENRTEKTRSGGFDACKGPLDKYIAKTSGVDDWECDGNCYTRTDYNGNVQRGCYKGEYKVNQYLLGCHWQGSYNYCFCKGDYCNGDKIH